MDAYCMDRGWFCSGPTVKLCVWLRQVFQSKTEALNLSCINFIGYNIWGPQISTGAGHRKKKQPHTQKAIVGIWFRDLPNRQWEHNCNRYLVETGRKKKKKFTPSDGECQWECEAENFLKLNEFSWVSDVLCVPLFFWQYLFLFAHSCWTSYSSIDAVHLTCLLEDNQSSTRWVTITSVTALYYSWNFRPSASLQVFSTL